MDDLTYNPRFSYCGLPYDFYLYGKGVACVVDPDCTAQPVPSAVVLERHEGGYGIAEVAPSFDMGRLRPVRRAFMGADDLDELPAGQRSELCDMFLAAWPVLKEAKIPSSTGDGYR